MKHLLPAAAMVAVLAAYPILPAAAACHIATFVGDPYEVSEGAGNVTITVSNNGGAGSGSIDYKTVNGTAKSGQDYDNKQGTLEFTEGTGVLSFDVPIENDTKNEQNETFRVELSNATGCFSTIQEDTAVVTIQDNDKLITLPTATPTPTPTPTKKATPKPKPSTASASPSPSPARSASPTPTTTTSPVAQAADDDGGGLSGGAVAAIVTVALVAGGAAAFWVRRRFLT